MPSIHPASVHMKSTLKFAFKYVAITKFGNPIPVSFKAVVGSPAMAGLVFGYGIKLTSSIISINFRIYSFYSFVNFEINSARLEYILSLSSFDCGIAV